MRITRSCAAFVAAAGFVLSSAPVAAVQDTDLPLGVSWNGDAPGGAPPWVNVLFRDFSDADPGAYGDFEWIRNTVEVQVTTGSDFYDEPGGSCCGVQGKGNLTAYENLKAIWLNFNHSLDIKKLKIYWTGSPMPDGPAGANTFPAAGLQPTDIAIGENKFKAGASCSFDILIQWKGGKKLGQDADHSKLLFVYENGATDISAEDFLVAAAPCKKNAPGPFIGVGHIQNTSGADGGGWIKDGGAE